MSSSSVEKIKERLDAVSLIGSYLKLEKAGGSFKARCPFHNEKTPSFFVSPARGGYYCFGCGAKGDIFTFVQEFEGLDFVGALKMLAEKAGVELEKFEPRRKGELDALYSLLDEAATYFEEGLKKNSKAAEYLLGRGLSRETQNKWRLGYARNDWRTLLTHFTEKGITEERLENAGLVKKSDEDKSGRYYDVFRGRIIFPIFDSVGRVIAFSGRIFDDVPDAPKYLNSPETEVFSKSETLYGLHAAKIGIRKKDYSLLVEGQMDLLACHEAGIDNTVASSGTAFTEAQLFKLQRLSQRILFVFDSDSAGFQAGLKSASLALSLGLEVKLAELPKGEDPAEMIRKNPEAFRATLKNSKHLINFHLDRLLREKTDERKFVKEVEKRILPHVARLRSAMEQSHFIALISRKTGIKEDALWKDLSVVIRGKTSPEEQEIVRVESSKKRGHVERRLFGILYWLGSDGGTLSRKIKSALSEALGGEGMAKAEAEHEKERESLVFEAESYYESKDHSEKDLDELIANFREDILREKFVEAMRELGFAEGAKDEKKSKELLSSCQKIAGELAELSKKRLSG